MLGAAASAAAAEDAFVASVWGAIEGVPYESRLPSTDRLTVIGQENLPPGLRVGADGTLRGIPKAAGRFSFLVRFRGQQEKATARHYILIVSPASDQFGPPAYRDGARGRVVSSCSGKPLQSGEYRLTNDVVATDLGQRCFEISGNVQLDLNGHEIRGRVHIAGDPSGSSLRNGRIVCNWQDHEGDAGCVLVTGEGDGPPLVFDGLYVENRAQTSRGVHVDWARRRRALEPSLVITRSRFIVGPQPTAPRSYAVSIIGGGHYVEFASNSISCSAEARACQGIMCYAVDNCKIHHNLIIMERNTTDENGRAILFDGGTRFGEAWNNVVQTFNNRAVRIRDSSNIRIHDNRFFQISDGQNGLGAVHLGDPDKGVNRLNSRIDHNLFESTGGNLFFVRGTENVEASGNSATCISGCATASFAKVRAWEKSEIIFRNNRLIGFPSPNITLEKGARIWICDSGTTAGAGTAFKIRCPVQSSPKP